MERKIGLRTTIIQLEVTINNFTINNSASWMTEKTYYTLIWGNKIIFYFSLKTREKNKIYI